MNTREQETRLKVKRSTPLQDSRRRNLGLYSKSNVLDKCPVTALSEPEYSLWP